MLTQVPNSHIWRWALDNTQLHQILEKVEARENAPTDDALNHEDFVDDSSNFVETTSVVMQSSASTIHARWKVLHVVKLEASSTHFRFRIKLSGYDIQQFETVFANFDIVSIVSDLALGVCRQQRSDYFQVRRLTVSQAAIASWCNFAEFKALYGPHYIVCTSGSIKVVIEILVTCKCVMRSLPQNRVSVIMCVTTGCLNTISGLLKVPDQCHDLPLAFPIELLQSDCAKLNKVPL